MHSPADTPLPADPGPRARELLARIAALQRELLAADYAAAADPGFVQTFRQILDCAQEYQHQVLAYHGRTPTCSSGCATCCYHWVEDVNSFEAQLIARALIDRCSREELEQVHQQCRADEQVLEQLEKITAAKYRGLTPSQANQMDEIDLLLASFYQFRRACPLLDSAGNCSVYDWRPLTCRIYFSFADPRRCDPEYINESDAPTFLLDFDDEVNDLFDTLHFRYEQFPQDTGLRSLLASHLEQHFGYGKA